MRTVRAELKRLLARRAVVALLLVGVGASVLIGGVTVWQHRPVSESELASAQARAEREATRHYVERQLEDCSEHPRRYGGNCKSLVPQAEWYLERAQLEPGSTLTDTVPAVVALLALLALIAGTSYVGAEFSSGSMANVLLFEPRRLRVWTAKLVATGATMTVFATLVLGVYITTIALLGHAWTDVTWTGDQVWNNVYRGIRGVVLVAAAGMAGAAITLVGRSTVLTVGTVLGYALVGEALLRALAASTVNAWLLSHHILGFLKGRFRFVLYDDVREVFRFHLAPSALYLGIGMALVLVTSALAFRRRDVP